MIVLTDGEPSQGDMEPNIVIETAKKLGVKIYTVGIGSDKDELMMHPLFGMVPKPKINKELLTLVATKTGGQFFQVRSTQDMRKMYDTIDTLEKQKIETSLFNNYYDIFLPFVWALFIIMLIELALAATWWFSI
jgi:Ca-activated chloride channel family protein